MKSGAQDDVAVAPRPRQVVHRPRLLLLHLRQEPRPPRVDRYEAVHIS